MAVPTGKGFYERLGSAYPNGDPVRWAQEIGASFIVLHMSYVSPQKVARAKAAGLRMWFWSGPESWNVANWRATYERQVQLSARYRADGVEGFIPDIEELDWVQAPESERQAMYTALRVASETFSSVGFTSYPSWPYHRRIAEAAPRIWASPQLYGIRTPGTGPELRARGARWRAVFRGGYCPSIAAWKRPPHEQAAFLRDFVQEEGVIFWHGLPAARSVRKAVLQAFTLVGEEPASQRARVAAAPDMGTALGRVRTTVSETTAGYANRRRQALARLEEFITVPEAIGAGTVGAASAMGRDRVAALDRTSRMQSSSRADLYSAAEGLSTVLTGVMDRAFARIGAVADRSISLPVVRDALGFDFNTGEWTDDTTTNQMSATDMEAVALVRDGGSDEDPNDLGPSSEGV